MNKNTMPMDDGYFAEIDSVNEASWYDIMSQFRDANLYQTWAYGSVRYGTNNLSHIVLKKGGQIIAATQIRIVAIPFIKAGIAYVRWGPLWRKNIGNDNPEDFRKIIIAMYREYVDHRGLCLRLIPNEVEQENKELQSILEDTGFKWHGSDYRTLYLPLSEPLDKIRNNMSKNWRKNLTKAEKKGLSIVEGSDQDLFESVMRLYREMLLRKGFEPGIDIDEYPLIQAGLPEKLKMKIMVCKSEEQPIAGLVGSSIGDVGIELVAATGNDSLDVGASFLLRWKMTEYLKTCGCNFYNLNGISPERNPGGYQFKSGLAGKSGIDLKFLGMFQAKGSWINSYAVKGGELSIARYKKMMQKIKSMRNISDKVITEK
ncbi:MAG: hypothetical protein WBN77_09400 [Desulfobacterales bacterium]